MSNSVRGTLLICSGVLSFTLARGQITITQADVNRILSPGNTIPTITDSSLSSVNIGIAGSLTNDWNFSALTISSFQVLRSVAASGTPHIGNFTGATNAFRLDTTLSGISGSIYQYLQLSATELRNIGAMATALGGLVSFRVFVTPSELVYRLPAAVGTSWATQFSNRTLIVINGGTVSDVTHNHNARYWIDAAGTMRLPGVSRSIYALRIRKVNFYDGGPVGGYIFISRGGALVQFETYDTTTVSGTIPVTRGKTIWNTSISSDSTTDVRVNDDVPSEFALKQNYPNPFNPTTHIEYHVPKEQFVSIRVYNLIGQEVTSLVNETKPAGAYFADWNAEGLPSGMYFCTMQSGSFSTTRRMMLLK